MLMLFVYVLARAHIIKKEGVGRGGGRDETREV